ncbi:hypothetical protein IWX85_003985 [Polaromonas sp. CG_9.11]|nr:hypothetical protein [Polaromonas sp. CG_9.11]
MTVEMKPLPNDQIDALLANYTKPDTGLDSSDPKTRTDFN